MTVKEMLKAAQYLIDKEGNRTAVLFDYALWEEFLELLEDIEDAEEFDNLQESDDEMISWEQAKNELRSGGLNV